MLVDSSREFFLRGKIYDLYLFQIKTFIGLSSIVIGLSVPALNTVSATFPFSTPLVYLGWGSLILCIILSASIASIATKTYYLFVHNLVTTGKEICKLTEKLEIQISDRTKESLSALIAGIVLIMSYISLNS